ncbi:hypothetical protein ABPG75_011836 [Micractinium tetrahymenae]
MAGRGAALAAAYDSAARQRQRQQFLGISAFDRHKKLVHDLVAYYGAQLPAGGQAGPQKTDFDILRENFRFIRSEEDDATDSWEVRLAKRYYSKLFKEYAIADLSRYKEGRVGLRWRTQREVVAGRGQFCCGATGCEERRGLASFEVPFAYQEAGERRQALVKVRLCPTHAYQLNYRKQQEAERAHKERRRREKRRRKREEEKEGKRGRRDGKASGSKERKRRRSRPSSSSSGSSEDSSSGCSEDSSSSSFSSDDSDGEAKGRRSGKRRRRQREAEEQQQQAPQAAGAAAAGGEVAPADDEFEAFMQGLFQ